MPRGSGGHGELSSSSSVTLALKRVAVTTVFQETCTANNSPRAMERPLSHTLVQNRLSSARLLFTTHRLLKNQGLF